MNTDDCPHCGEDISDVTHRLKNALEKTREERASYKGKASKAKDDLRQAKTELEDATIKLKDADPQKSQQLQTELDEANAKLADTVPKSDFESLATELEESKATATKLQDEATQGKIATAVAKVGGNLAMLSPMIKAKLAESPDLDLDAHLTALRNDSDFGGAFKASDQSGGGGPAGKDSTGTFKAKQSLRRSQMSDAEKNGYQKEHGLDALLDLPM